MKLFVFFLVVLFGVYRVLSTTTIIIAGGINNDGQTSDTEVIEISGSTSRQSICPNVPNLYLPLAQHAATLMNDTTVILCGGYSGNRYDIISDCHYLTKGGLGWKMAPSMNDPRHRFSMSSASGIVYATGSWGNRHDSTSAEMCDSNKWSRIRTMPVTMRLHCQVTISNDLIMSISGAQNEWADLTDGVAT